MKLSGFMHELREFIHCKSDVWTGEREVLERPNNTAKLTGIYGGKPVS
jgi:hypothetical protein